jgi:hypothetical protein
MKVIRILADLVSMTSRTCFFLSREALARKQSNLCDDGWEGSRFIWELILRGFRGGFWMFSGNKNVVEWLSEWWETVGAEEQLKAALRILRFVEEFLILRAFVLTKVPQRQLKEDSVAS